MEGRPPVHPDAESRIFSLAQPLEEPDRSTFIKVATEAVEKIGPDACGPGVVHRLLTPLWRQFFHPPSSETIQPNRSRAYYDDGDDDPEARVLTKSARDAVRRIEEGGQTRRRPVAGIRQLIE
jgi:hypothetical protein